MFVESMHRDDDGSWRAGGKDARRVERRVRSEDLSIIKGLIRRVVRVWG